MASRRPMRFGVIGCGTIAYWTHLRILPRLAGVKVVAIADPSEAALARARRLVDARGYEDPAELLSSADVDAVVIAAPTSDHASLAMAACRASKHVYVEKPLATSVQDARRVVAAAEASGVEAVVGFQRRFHPSYQRVRALVAGGAIGRVRGVQSVFGEPAPADGLPVEAPARHRRWGTS